MLRDTELSFVAIDSALSIDRHLLGKAEEKDYETIKTLAREIENYSKDYLDLTKRVMFAEVVWPNKEDWKGRTLDEVNLQINFFSKDLYCFKELSKERQKTLREVCTDLCKKSMRYFDIYYRCSWQHKLF